ncbi:MAG: tetratricopeptide repeat protein [Bacteroidota bacterium]
MKFTIRATVCGLLLLIGCAKMSEEELWQKVEQSQASANVDSTILMCQTILTNYPEGKNAPAALFMLGQAYNSKHDFHAAVNYYGAFVKKYPDLNSTPLAMFFIGFIYNNNLQMFDSARLAYQDFIAKFPNHSLAASAKFELDNIGKTPDEIIGMKKDVAIKAKKHSMKK